MNELCRAATEAELNIERLHQWRQRYFMLFGRYPDGDDRRHRRCCVIDDFKRMAKDQ